MSLDLLKSSWIDLEYRGSSFTTLLDQQIDVIVGVGGKTSEILHQIEVDTVRDLATLPTYLNALALDPLDRTAMKVSVGSLLSADLAPELREKRLAGLLALRIRTVADMRGFKFASWAKAILELAPSEKHRPVSFE